ncbi:MAG: carbohydrate kinase [Actinomycetota bacterium]
MILSCGEALVDLVPDPVPGGGPMNVAVAASRRGAATAFVGCLSTDRYGEMITAHLRGSGVDLSLTQTSDRPTARAIVEHVPRLAFTFEGEDTADTRLGPVDPSVLDRPARIVHGGTLGLFRGRTAESLASLAEAHDGLVSLDPNVRPQIIEDREAWLHFHQRWVTATDLYKGSDEDLDWIWPDRPVEDCVDQLLDQGVAAVVVTRGAEGIEVITRAGTAAAPAPAVDIVDTVGAGDTIVAAFLVALAERDAVTGAAVRALTETDWATIGAGATEAAAITCSRPGADPPHRHEISW